MKIPHLHWMHATVTYHHNWMHRLCRVCLARRVQRISRLLTEAPKDEWMHLVLFDHPDKGLTFVMDSGWIPRKSVYYNSPLEDKK